MHIKFENQDLNISITLKIICLILSTLLAEAKHCNIIKKSAVVTCLLSTRKNWSNYLNWVLINLFLFWFELARWSFALFHPWKLNIKYNIIEWIIFSIYHNRGSKGFCLWRRTWHQKNPCVRQRGVSVLYALWLLPLFWVSSKSLCETHLTNYFLSSLKWNTQLNPTSILS